TAQGKDPNAICVRDVMTAEVITCCEDQLVSEAARLMEERQVRRLLVLNRDKQLVGIVSLGDLAIQTGDQQLAGQILEQVSEPAPPWPTRCNMPTNNGGNPWKKRWRSARGSFR